MALSLNQRAWQIADRLADDAEALGVAVQILTNGTRVIDCGIDVEGGLEAGRLFAEACMGGLGNVTFTSVTLDGWWIPALTVHTARPTVACLAAQYAGWQVSQDTYFAMGSGPARALIRAEELYEEIGYRDEADVAVLCMESRTLPSEEIAGYIAERAGVEPAALTLLIAPTASSVGSVQVAARVLETGLHKLHAIGFDPQKVINGFGTCPIPPIAKNDTRAIGRTNDAILYGGQVHCTVRVDNDDELEKLIPQVPASTSPDYGLPFYETFTNYNYNFYDVDPLLFSPAEIYVTNVITGNTFHAGSINIDVLKRSFGAAR
jgi:methenyltetrahydromethanopterin cyclohydrolase